MPVTEAMATTPRTCSRACLTPATSSAGRVGVRAVAEHAVERAARGRGRVGHLRRQALVAQRRLDHRVRPAAREDVVAEVEQHVARHRLHAVHAQGRPTCAGSSAPRCPRARAAPAPPARWCRRRRGLERRAAAAASPPAPRPWRDRAPRLGLRHAGQRRPGGRRAAPHRPSESAKTTCPGRRARPRHRRSARPPACRPRPSAAITCSATAAAGGFDTTHEDLGRRIGGQRGDAEAAS